MARLVYPIMAFMGVRISWLMLNRNWLLARLPSTARIFSRSTSSFFLRTWFCTYSITIRPIKTMARSTMPVNTSVSREASSVALAYRNFATHMMAEYRSRANSTTPEMDMPLYSARELRRMVLQ